MHRLALALIILLRWYPLPRHKHAIGLVPKRSFRRNGADHHRVLSHGLSVHGLQTRKIFDVTLCTFS